MRLAYRWNVEKLCNYVVAIATATVTFEGAVQKVDASKVAEPLKSAIGLASDYALEAILIASFVGLVARAVSKWFGRALEWKLIQFQLDQLSDELFSSAEYADIGANRVTLFRHKRFLARWPRMGFRPKFWFRGPWAGWLFQVARSGHLVSAKKTCFYCPQDSDKAEGIAGRAWMSRTAILVDKLPQVHETCFQDKIRTYSQRTGVSSEWIRKAVKGAGHQSKSLPRSLFGTAIESKSGRWGVLVLDSRSETMASAEELARICTPIVKNLAMIIDRV